MDTHNNHSTETDSGYQWDYMDDLDYYYPEEPPKISHVSLNGDILHNDYNPFEDEEKEFWLWYDNWHERDEYLDAHMPAHVGSSLTRAERVVAAAKRAHNCVAARANAEFMHDVSLISHIEHVSSGEERYERINTHYQHWGARDEKYYAKPKQVEQKRAHRKLPRNKRESIRYMTADQPD